MTPTPFVPDYGDFFQQERHSNVSSLIVEEAGAPGDASVARKLPGHSMVLAAFSHYCKAKLETWSHTGSFQSSRVQDASLAWPLGPLVALFNYCKAKLAPWSYAGAYNSSSTEGKLQVLLPVPAGQQELAELLVKGMYQAQPTITDGLSQLQLLQLMLLADRFGVPKVQAAVAAALNTVDVQHIDWDAAVELLQLPPSCAQQPEFEAVRQVAVQQVQQQLGDLEGVWADPARQQLLLALPCEALMQLLQDDTTCVATENTVVYTIERWWSAQDAALQHAEHLRALMHLVRMRYCTPYYSGTVMHQSSPVQQSFEHAALPLMRECCTTGGYARLQEAQCLVLHRYPAWVAEQRPASARQPVIEWRLPLASLRAAVDQLLSSGKAATYDFSDTYLPAGSIRLVAATISVLSLRKAASLKNKFKKRPMSAELASWGFSKLVPLGAARSWQAVKAELYRQQLVHGDAASAAVSDQDDSLHLNIQVKVETLL
uniref:BACK domain-containing protein n=1 Tax=Tetradesmus obliquus TaxID=3088 RepID=A0A383VDD8_TETOB|eukprot:jgi/Sobl393_1/2831/SZX73914.1